MVCRPYSLRWGEGAALGLEGDAEFGFQLGDEFAAQVGAAAPRAEREFASIVVCVE